VSGIYYPVAVLPAWVQPLAALSPATYALAAARKLMGLDRPLTEAGTLAGAPLSSVTHELGILALMGLVLVPLGLWIFGRVEHWAHQLGERTHGHLVRPAPAQGDGLRVGVAVEDVGQHSVQQPVERIGVEEVVGLVVHRVPLGPRAGVAGEVVGAVGTAAHLTAVGSSRKTSW